MRRDLTIDEPFEQTDRAISSVARESSGLQTKAARDAFYRGPVDRYLHYAIGTRSRYPWIVESELRNRFKQFVIDVESPVVAVEDQSCAAAGTTAGRAGYSSKHECVGMAFKA